MNKPFTLDEFRMQFENIQKLGVREMASRIPGFDPGAEDPDAALMRVRGIIDAMTPEERADPDIIDAARRDRIATTAGVQPEAVTDFLKQFEMARVLMEQMMSMSLWQRLQLILGWRPFPQLPPPT
jgi:signal recognition particle subunit SRP54